MRLSTIDRLRCPSCLRAGVEARFEVDPTRVGGGEDGGRAGDLLEAFLVCVRCRDARPLLSGIAVVVADLPAHLVAHGNVYRRAPIADPRLTRFVLGGAGMGGDVIPFDEVVARYGDLLPTHPDAGDGMPAMTAMPADEMPVVTAPSPRPYDVAMREAVADALAMGDAHGPALEIGCGVGRGVFTLAGLLNDATGVDRSLARVRRARNVQTTDEFHLPRRPGSRVETPIDLTGLHRDGTDFVVAGPDPLPLGSQLFGLVVLREGDGDGRWQDSAAALAEAERVLASDGLLLVERTTDDGVELDRRPAQPLFDRHAASGLGGPGAQ